MTVKNFWFFIKKEPLRVKNDRYKYYSKESLLLVFFEKQRLLQILNIKKFLTKFR